MAIRTQLGNILVYEGGCIRCSLYDPLQKITTGQMQRKVSMRCPTSTNTSTTQPYTEGSRNIMGEGTKRWKIVTAED